MVEITKIESQKNKNKFNLFVDGQFYSDVLKEVAITNNFFVGKKISKRDLDNILLQSESRQAFNKGSDYLASRLHTRQELYLKLIKKGFNSVAINMALDKLQEYGYINDSEFAKTYSQTNNKLSKKMLEQKLACKGVNRQDIANSLQHISSQDELQNAIALAQKYLKNKSLNDCKEKLYAFLQRKGFDYGTINKAIKEISGVDIDWEE